MGKSLESLSKGAWVDLYTGDTFGGKFSRFHAGRRGKSGFAGVEKLKVAGSLIVGPGTVARVKLEGAAGVLTLRPGTVVGELAKLTRHRAIVFLEIAKEAEVAKGAGIAKGGGIAKGAGEVRVANSHRRRRSAGVLVGV
jgi:hypothetical protein